MFAITQLLFGDPLFLEGAFERRGGNVEQLLVRCVNDFSGAMTQREKELRNSIARRKRFDRPSRTLRNIHQRLERKLCNRCVAFPRGTPT